MAKLSYYRQRRVDGAIRSGIDIDGESAWQHFEATNDSENIDRYDPTLLWFIDIDFEGEQLPVDLAGSRQWFLDHAEVIKAWLLEIANEHATGIDHDIYPLLIPCDQLLAGAQGTLRLAAMRRVASREVVGALRDLAGDLPAKITELSPPTLV